MRRLSGLARAAPACIAIACSSRAPAPDGACTDTLTQGIINGTPRDALLGLTDAQASGVVQVVDGSRPDGALCSGVLLARAWVVTAAHCLDIQAPVVRVGASAAWSVIGSVAHPTQDVALLAVSPPDVDGSDLSAMPLAQPFAWARPPDSPPSVGERVEIAGYGLTETRAAYTLRFAVESVVGVDAATVTVSGAGVTGACAGDSGGPLLASPPGGGAVVVGVLSEGSASCVGEDTYVRLDAISGWIESTIGAVPAQRRPCSGSE